MANTSISMSAPGNHNRDTSTVVMVGGVPARQLQHGFVTEVETRQVGILPSRGGNGSGIIEDDHEAGLL
jgi:hypothetical protein